MKLDVTAKSKSVLPRLNSIERDTSSTNMPILRKSSNIYKDDIRQKRLIEISALSYFDEFMAKAVYEYRPADHEFSMEYWQTDRPNSVKLIKRLPRWYYERLFRVMVNLPEELQLIAMTHIMKFAPDLTFSEKKTF